MVINSKNQITSGSLRGTQPKWFQDNKYIKTDQVGYEGMAEEFASRFISQFTDLPVVLYTAVEVYDEDDLFKGSGCYSENYNNGFVEVTLLDLLVQRGYTESELIATTGVRRWDLFKKHLTGTELTYLLNILVIDTLILNDDRHMMNLGFYYMPDGTRKMLPIFDNGAAFLSDEDMYRYKRSIPENIALCTNRLLDVSILETVDILRHLNVPKLVFNKEQLFTFIDSYTCSIDLYKEMEITRCKESFKYQLEQLEGMLWESI